MNHSLEILVFSFTTVSMQRTGLNEKNNFEVTTVGWILSFVWISFFPLQKRARITFPYVARVLWRQIHIKIMRLPLEYLHWMLGPKGHMKYLHSIFSISLSSSHCAAQHVLFDNLTTLNRCFLFALPTQVLFFFFFFWLIKSWSLCTMFWKGDLFISGLWCFAATRFHLLNYSQVPFGMSTSFHKLSDQIVKI